MRSPVRRPGGAAGAPGARKSRPAGRTRVRSGRRRAPARSKRMATAQNSDGNEIANRRRTVPNEGGRLSTSNPGEGRPSCSLDPRPTVLGRTPRVGRPSLALPGPPPLLTLPEKTSRRHALLSRNNHTHRTGGDGRDGHFGSPVRRGSRPSLPSTEHGEDGRDAPSMWDIRNSPGACRRKSVIARHRSARRKSV